MKITSLPQHHVAKHNLTSQRLSDYAQTAIRFRADDHDHSKCNGHQHNHNHDSEPKKPFSLTETLIHLGTWFKELFTGLWQDMIYLLKGPEAKEIDEHQHGPNCNH